MPLYEYRCHRCGSTFEVLQKAGQDPPGKCPDCGGPVSKLLSPPAIQFKGGGWYVTDYAKKPSKDADPKPAAASDKPAAGTEASDKAKPGSKPPAASSE